MKAIVKDIIKAMQTIAPSSFAEKWDNVGLQVGEKDWAIKKIWIALDPLKEIVEAACKKEVDLLITHHPLIFKPLKCVDLSTTAGSIINMAICNRMAIFSAHTNLDKARGGINDILADIIGLKNLKVLNKPVETEKFKLVVYVPVEHEKRVFETLFESGVGKIGDYTCCTFRNYGTGTFKPGSDSKPFTGKIGEISHTDESRIELVVEKNNLKQLIENVGKHHPYETPAYDIYPLFESETESSAGLGRIGETSGKVSLLSLAKNIKKKLGIKYIKIAGRPDLTISKVAVCSGSGSSLMDDFLVSGAEIFISGDLGYHNARAVEAADRGLIDIGHFASEHIIVKHLAEKLRKILTEVDFDVEIKACDMEVDPFMVL
ncbi:MAG: Nif3-like dinuclear metal center hexameric protein [Deltaproteobacteria bacterium]|nr:Nif3-like dinuclear metal center hexameric protein [Deltaproteobacteria bacterium]